MTRATTPTVASHLIKFITPDDVRDYRTRLDATISAMDAKVGTCAGLDAGIREGWAKFAAAWRVREEPSWLHALAQYETTEAYEHDVAHWQDMIALREAKERCRAERLAARERARTLRLRLLEELQEAVRSERQSARQTCSVRLGEARSIKDDIKRARAKLLAERQYQADLRRIE